MEQMPLRKNFYREVNHIKKMSQDEVEAYRVEMGIKVECENIPRKHVPSLVKVWNEAGLLTKLQEKLMRKKLDAPTAFQAQILPVVMSGLHCVGIGKHGSGKKVAFMLPMLRHIYFNLPVEYNHGPVAVVLASNRQNCLQIKTAMESFVKAMGFSSVVLTGGVEGYQDFKKVKAGGYHILIATPGKIYSLLCKKNKHIKLQTASFLVTTEADALLARGVGHMALRIINNMRPGSQAVLFSATSSDDIQAWATKYLVDYVVISTKIETVEEHGVKEDDTDRGTEISAKEEVGDALKTGTIVKERETEVASGETRIKKKLNDGEKEA